MTAIPITCDNCGAKYRLPENFTGSTSKCQKCGSVIDVAKQRASATSPEGAMPAAAARPASAARLAVDRSREAPKPVERRPTRTEPAPRAASTAGEGDRSRSRRGRGERQAKKSGAMQFVIGGVGLLAIIVVVVLVKSAG
jgi:cobalamin biosynthesis Mg chelatase CobN